MSYKAKKRWKGIIAAVLVIGASIAACAGLAVISKNDTQKIRASAFSRGDLDDKGIYVESDKSIYTKEAFGCIGLRVEPDFESKVTYDVYYYDYDERLIEARKGFSGVYDEDYPLAQYARIVIHPEIPADVSEKDFKINFWEESKYAKQLTITVDKKQNYLYENSVNLYIEENVQTDTTFNTSSSDTTVELKEGIGVKTTEKINVTGEYEYYDIYVRRTVQSDIFLVGVVSDMDNKILVKEAYDLAGLKAGEWCRITLEVPEYEGDMYLISRMPSDAECYIFGYNK